MNINRLVKYTVILSIIPAIYYSFFPGKIVAITIICLYPILFGLLTILLENKTPKIEAEKLVAFFILYNCIVFMRGIANADYYEDWTSLFSSSIASLFFIPCCIYFGAQVSSIQILIKTFLIYGLFLSSILLFQNDDSGPLGFVHTISPIYILIIFVPYFPKYIKILTVIVAIISFFSDISIRSNLLNIIIAFTILSSYYLRKKKFLHTLIKATRVIFIIIPIIFLLLGISGLFNVFQAGDLIERVILEDSKGKSQDLFIDSRTKVYEDVFFQLEKEKAYFFGLSAIGKTVTHLTEITHADFYVIYKHGRGSTESGMLNYIQWGGAIGGFLYFLLFIKASYLGIYQSKNWLSVMLGLWLSFKGFYSFIEDHISFTAASVFIFASIGICLNKRFREMTDHEIKKYFNIRLLSFKLKS